MAIEQSTDNARSNILPPKRKPLLTMRYRNSLYHLPALLSPLRRRRYAPCHNSRGLACRATPKRNVPIRAVTCQTGLPLCADLRRDLPLPAVPRLPCISIPVLNYPRRSLTALPTIAILVRDWTNNAVPAEPICSETQHAKPQRSLPFQPRPAIPRMHRSLPCPPCPHAV